MFDRNIQLNEKYHPAGKRAGRAAALLLAGCILYAYLARGAAAGVVGGIAVVSMVLSIMGIRAAVKGFRERERNYLTCKIGLPGSTLVLLLFLAIFIGGLS